MQKKSTLLWSLISFFCLLLAKNVAIGQYNAEFHRPPNDQCPNVAGYYDYSTVINSSSQYIGDVASRLITVTVYVAGTSTIVWTETKYSGTASTTYIGTPPNNQAAIDHFYMPYSAFASYGTGNYDFKVHFTWPTGTGSAPYYYDILLLNRSVTILSVTEPSASISQTSAVNTLPLQIAGTYAGAGSGTPSLQWYNQGVAITGATGNTLSLSSTSSSDYYTFKVTPDATNSCPLTATSNTIYGFTIVTPVTYGKALTALVTANTVDLSWTTAQEVNNKGFAVQRSTDGKIYSEIGYVGSPALNGNSGQPIGYSYTDKVPAFGTNYYRLFQEDLDGTGKNSDIVNVQYDGVYSAAIKIYPNPVNDYVNVDNVKIGDQLTFVSMDGKVLKTEKVATLPHKVDTKAFLSGFYILKVTHLDGTSVSMKFMKK